MIGAPAVPGTQAFVLTSRLFESALATVRMAGFLLAAPSAVTRANGDDPSRGGADASIRLRLDPDVEAAGKAREAIERLEEGLEREVLQDVHLLVTELVTNSVRHADAAAGEPVDVEVSVRGDHVFLAVEDGGSGFQPRPRSAHSPRDSGWGLHLVERLSSRWGVSGDGRTRVWLELARRGRVEAA